MKHSILRHALSPAACVACRYSLAGVLLERAQRANQLPHDCPDYEVWLGLQPLQPVRVLERLPAKGVVHG